MKKQRTQLIGFISMFVEVPAVPRSSVDMEPPYDTEMEDSQSDNLLLKVRGKCVIDLINPLSSHNRENNN